MRNPVKTAKRQLLRVGSCALSALMVLGSIPAAAIGDGVTATYDEAYYAMTDYYGNLTDGSVVKSYRTNGIATLTDYGDYDFEVAIADGRIVGADYEVDEEWLDALGGSPVTAEEAASIVAGKIPGASAADVDIWEESGDGRGRYEGELFLDGMKYEFEIDPQTGRIFDWNADLRD